MNRTRTSVWAPKILKALEEKPLTHGELKKATGADSRQLARGLKFLHGKVGKVVMDGRIVYTILDADFFIESAKKELELIPRTFDTIHVSKELYHFIQPQLEEVRKSERGVMWPNPKPLTHLEKMSAYIEKARLEFYEWVGELIRDETYRRLKPWEKELFVEYDRYVRMRVRTHPPESGPYSLSDERSRAAEKVWNKVASRAEKRFVSLKVGETILTVLFRSWQLTNTLHELTERIQKMEPEKLQELGEFLTKVQLVDLMMEARPGRGGPGHEFTGVRDMADQVCKLIGIPGEGAFASDAAREVYFRAVERVLKRKLDLEPRLREKLKDRLGFRETITNIRARMESQEPAEEIKTLAWYNKLKQQFERDHGDNKSTPGGEVSDQPSHPPS